MPAAVASLGGAAVGVVGDFAFARAGIRGAAHRRHVFPGEAALEGDYRVGGTAGEGEVAGAAFRLEGFLHVGADRGGAAGVDDRFGARGAAGAGQVAERVGVARVEASEVDFLGLVDGRMAVAAGGDAGFALRGDGADLEVRRAGVALIAAAAFLHHVGAPGTDEVARGAEALDAVVVFVGDVERAGGNTAFTRAVGGGVARAGELAADRAGARRPQVPGDLFGGEGRRHDQDQSDEGEGSETEQGEPPATARGRTTPRDARSGAQPWRRLHGGCGRGGWPGVAWIPAPSRTNSRRSLLCRPEPFQRIARRMRLSSQSLIVMNP